MNPPTPEETKILLDCPFCGKQPRSRYHESSAPGSEDCGFWGIDCCLAHAHGDDEQEAAEKWNNQLVSQRADALADVLRESFEAFRDYAIWQGACNDEEALSGAQNVEANKIDERVNAAFKRMEAALTPPPGATEHHCPECSGSQP